MTNLLKTAQEGVLKAGKAALALFRKEHEYHHKGEDANFSTEADLESEKILYEMVKDKFPKHNFLSEEMGLVDCGSDWTWVIDPIDGTFNFSHGQPLWGVECGIFKGDKPVIGVLYFPVLKELYFAQKEKGAYLDKEPLAVSKIGRLSQALIALSLSYPAQRKLQKLPYEKLIHQGELMISQSLSTAYDLAAVASGRTDGFIEELTCIWDIAGGVVLIEEAGGKVTDWEGKKLVWEIRKNKLYNLIATNSLIYKPLREKFDHLRK
ncbi:inositol monophosphatase [Candidatus Microgenomates bacterium]|nr:inositol monophosphatase [Candidatus Microgenomates bacterium]